MSVHDDLQRNLARLRKQNSSLVDAIEAADLEGVEIQEGRRKSMTVSCEGVLLGSAYDPQREGERMVEEMKPEAADILIALGFGLGFHLEAFRRKNSCPIIIYEPSVARLKAALSVRPSFTLAGLKDVSFATDLVDLGRRIQSVYTPGVQIRVYPHPAFLRLEPEATRAAVDQVSRTKASVDLTVSTRVRKTAPWAEITVDNASHLIQTPSFSRLFKAFPGTPAVIAAAGPSLDKQLPQLARVAERVIVIALGQTLGSLQHAGIQPDLVHVIESQDVSRQISEADGPDGVNLVTLPSVHSNLFEVPVETRFVSYPSANLIGRWVAGTLGDTGWVLGGATVAQSAVNLAAAMGADPIILIGQDLAYTGGRVYAKGSAYDYIGVQQTSAGSYVLTNVEKKREQLNRVRPDLGPNTTERERVQVEGWDGEMVETSISYASFIEAYRDLGAYLEKNGTRLINCTEGGARIPGIEHKTFAEALNECPTTISNTREIIQAAYHESPPPSPSAFREPLSKVARSLDTVEREARAGLQGVEGAGTALVRARSPERKIAILRKVGRCDRQVRRSLVTVPWLDAMVQPAIHRTIAAFRKAEAAAPTPEEAVEESRALFQAVVDGIDEARDLLERFEVNIASETHLERQSPEISIPSSA
jgi:hypothetical protein